MPYNVQDLPTQMVVLNAITQAAEYEFGTLRQTSGVCGGRYDME